jgi:hypothetical protein
MHVARNVLDGDTRKSLVVIDVAEQRCEDVIDDGRQLVDDAAREVARKDHRPALVLRLRHHVDSHFYRVDTFGTKIVKVVERVSSLITTRTLRRCLITGKELNVRYLMAPFNDTTIKGARNAIFPLGGTHLSFTISPKYYTDVPNFKLKVLS